jgi:hypothetical protein
MLNMRVKEQQSYGKNSQSEISLSADNRTVEFEFFAKLERLLSSGEWKIGIVETTNNRRQSLVVLWSKRRPSSPQYGYC